MSKRWLLIFVAAIILIMVLSGCTASGGSKPKTQVINIYLEQKFTRPEDPLLKINPEIHDQLITSFEEWVPNVIVVSKGDTVKLQVSNPLESIHSLAIPDFNVDTGSIAPKGGTATIEFVADKAGTFPFMCNTKWDSTKNPELCEPDHEMMTGTLIVLDR
ncbi:MAG: cupredoxin domain-containing protein [Actinobacteria bacterium]|nr:cupredoxin domain-containing protein [Actinomycetota bacterium]